MEKVYIVLSGEYSDRHVNEVFDSKEKAEEYARIRNRSEYSIYSDGLCYVEERNVVKDTNYADLLPKKYVLYIVYNYAYNNIQVSSVLPDEYFDEAKDAYFDGDDMSIRSECLIKKKETFSFEILRSYEEDIHDHLTYDRLLKIAQDRWAQFKARMEGIG